MDEVATFQKTHGSQIQALNCGSTDGSSLDQVKFEVQNPATQFALQL